MITQQGLRDCDPVQPMAFCSQLVNTVEQNPQFLDQFIVSNEAVFSLNLEVNTRNVLDIHSTDSAVELNLPEGGGGGSLNEH